MIALVFSWTIIAVVFFTFGRGFMQLWNSMSKGNAQTSALDTALIGMCVIASLIAIASLWLPANFMLLFVLFFLCILYWLCNNKSIPSIANGMLDFVGRQPKWHLLLYTVLIISIAMFCTLHPIMIDTLYYHYQNIMWNESYSVVPGLANLQPRFAFNSSYFLLASTFGLKPWLGQYIFGIHTFCLVTIYVWVMYKVLHAKNIITSVIAVLMLTCLFVIYKIHITSVTTDFMPNLLVAYLIIKVILDRQAVDKNPVLYTILPVFIITLKLSCFAIAIIPLYVFWRQMKASRFKELGFLIAGSLLIVVPWCIRTVILSGYLIFPVPLDLFSFDWKIPIEYVVEQRDFIRSFAKYPNNLDINSVLAMPISEWFPIWRESDMQYYNPIANKFFFLLTILSIPIGALYLILRRKKLKGENGLVLFWIASVIGIAVWFFNAPDFRFIYGLILGQVFIVGTLLFEHVDKKIKKPERFSLQVALTIITIIFMSVYSARWVVYQKGDSVKITSLVKIPSSINHTKKMKKMSEGQLFFPEEINGIKIYRMSQSDRDVLCLDCELPCSADYVGGIEMRGKTLQEGFRCKPNAPHRLTY